MVEDFFVWVSFPLRWLFWLVCSPFLFVRGFLNCLKTLNCTVAHREYHSWIGKNSPDYRVYDMECKKCGRRWNRCIWIGDGLL